jgi:peroxin-14
METQKDLTDQRLKEINTELTSLKTLISQRMASSSASPSVAGRAVGGPQSPAFRAPSVADEKPAEAAKESEPVKPSTPSAANKGFTLGGTGGKASIPAWQMAMANKPATPTPAASSAATGSEAGGSSSQQEASGSA